MPAIRTAIFGLSQSRWWRFFQARFRAVTRCSYDGKSSSRRLKLGAMATGVNRLNSCSCDRLNKTVLLVCPRSMTLPTDTSPCCRNRSKFRSKLAWFSRATGKCLKRGFVCDVEVRVCLSVVQSLGSIGSLSVEILPFQNRLSVRLSEIKSKWWC